VSIDRRRFIVSVIVIEFMTLDGVVSDPLARYGRAAQ